MHFLKLSFFCLLLVLFSNSAQLLAQEASFPVTAVVRTLPPFSPSLADWADPFNDKLGLTLLLNDRQATGYQVRLRVTIEGQGITLRTKPAFQARPIALSYGIPTELRSTELAEYFNLDNLDFTGFDPASYLNQGGLPSGMYSLCVEAIDYDRFDEEAASPIACSFVQAALLDPPVILSPMGSQTAISPQNLAVQWQARHTASFLTDYTVSLYEINPQDQLTPEQVYALQQPDVFGTVSGITSLNVDQNFPQLQPGSQYLIRVRAEDPMGGNAFRNDGYSEPLFFTYGSACPLPLDFSISATPNSYDQVHLEFSTFSGAITHIIRYREQHPEANWYEEEVEYFSFVDLTDLSPSTIYEVQVQGLCSSGASAFSPVFTFETDARPFDPSDADCGEAIADLPYPTNTAPLTNLSYGDMVQVGNFEMKVTSASSAGGDGWKGAGQIYVAWLGANINCTFNRLYINTDKQVYDGVVLAKDDGLSSIPGFMSVAEVLAERDTSQLTFCGDSIVSSGSPSSPPHDLMYGTSTGSYSNVYVPYNPNNPNATTTTELFYSQWNPNNSTNPYTASDYNNPANPYTEERPYKATNIWNPWNGYNTYAPTDYGDPANPWTEEFPWTAERMFQKQAQASSATDPYIFTGGRNLPIAIGEGTNVMAFFGMKFTAVSGYLSAYASFDVPSGDTKKLVAFQAAGMGIQPGGLQGESKMKLMSNVSTTLGDKVKLTLEKGNSTFVSFDCGGITQISIAARIELCRDVATPLDINFEPVDNGYVTGNFIFSGTDFDELTGDVSISPFEHPKLPGWAFTVQNIVFDLSDKTTPSSVQFPVNYEHPDIDPAFRNGLNSPAWTGVYIGLAKLRIPDKLTKRDSTNSVMIEANSVIIDDTGFTGTFKAINPLTLEEGSVGSWAFAIEEIEVGIQQNQFRHVAMDGLIDIPALGQPLGYGCHIQPGSYYNFSVNLTDTVSFEAMAAKLDLYENTEIGITYRQTDRNFSAYAKLYGSATFGPKLGGNEEGSNTNTTASQEDKNKLIIPSIGFENFHLTTRKPYIESIGTWSLSTENGEQPGMKKFPVKLNSIGMVRKVMDNDTSALEVAFGIDLTVNLVKGEDQGFGARGNVFIVCDVTTDEEDGTQEWKFKKVKIKRLGINYEGAGFKFNGFIEEFSNKPLYGNGFTGGLQASFKPAISVGVAALFGTTQDDNGDDYRYFFADAMVAFNPGITLGPSGLAIYGFGGGVSYHMERQGFSNLRPPVSEATEADDDEDDEDEPLLPADFFDDDFDPEAEYELADEDIPMPPDVTLPTTIGASLSGVRYVPNKEVGIGIKASIAFGSVKREVFNGDLTFEIVFNSGGGMRYLGLTGNANFLTPPGPEAKPAVSALVDMGYDFNNKNFSAYLRLSLWAAKGVIRGAYPNGVAGEGNIYASEEDWWIYMGTPQNPFKISIDLSALANVGSEEERENEPDPPPPPPGAFSDEDLAAIGGGGAASGAVDAGEGFQDPMTQDRPPLGSIGDVGVLLRAYLDAGSVLPDFPPPPDRVQDILGEGDYQIIDPNNPVFANASGLLFGAGFDISMPDLKFLIFYAEFYAGMGFDMMISNLGQTARCANIETDGPIGLNGWYATGQLYAYLEGAVGIDIKLGSFNAKAEIFRVAAAVLLQGQMVNPVWMRGKMAGEYSVLNGLASGRCEFEFEAGTKCEVIDEGAQNIQVMQSITPDTFSTEVDVFVNPQITFNIPEGRALTFNDEEEDETFLLKAELIEFALINKTKLETEGVLERVPGTTAWNNDRTVVVFKPDDILAGNSEYIFGGESVLLKEENGQWLPVEGFGETQDTQRISTLFTTGPAPDIIVESNVTYAYPINKQTNFLIDESGQGYVQLDQGQDYLFTNLDRTEWNQVARFVQNGTVKGENPVNYNTSTNRVSFSLTSGGLVDREQISYLQLVNVPVNPPEAIDANVDSISRDITASLMPEDASFADNATNIVVREYVANGTLVQQEEKEIYRLAFRTSRYGTFTEKIAALQPLDPILINHALTQGEIILDEDGNQTGTGPFLSINEFGRKYESSEPLDKYDLLGDQFEKDIDPLIRGTAQLEFTANNWYRDSVAPMLYNAFPQDGFAINNRDPELLGYPPVRAINLRTNAPLPVLTVEQMASGNYSPPAFQEINAGYHLPYHMYRDMANLWNQVGSYLTTFEGTPPDFLVDFHEWRLPMPDFGEYAVKLQYFLPGKSQANSEVRILLPNDTFDSRK